MTLIMAKSCDEPKTGPFSVNRRCILKEEARFKQNCQTVNQRLNDFRICSIPVPIPSWESSLGTTFIYIFKPSISPLRDGLKGEIGPP